jgi:hypothetical protein
MIISAARYAITAGNDKDSVIYRHTEEIQRKEDGTLEMF